MDVHKFYKENYTESATETIWSKFYSGDKSKFSEASSSLFVYSAVIYRIFLFILSRILAQ